MLLSLRLAIIKWIARFLLSRPEEPVQWNFDPKTGIRVEAIAKLEEALPRLYSEDECPVVVGGTFSWQREFSEGYKVVPLDLVLLEQGRIFCLYSDYRRSSYHETSDLLDTAESSTSQYSNSETESKVLGQSNLSSVLGSPRRRLELQFRNQLLYGSEPIPIIPIFCDPQTILDCRSLDDLAYYLEDCWQDALDWAERQLPPLDDEADRLTPETGSPLQRRFWLAEARASSLLPIRHDLT